MDLSDIKSSSFIAYSVFPDDTRTPNLKRIIFKAFLTAFIVSLLVLVFTVEQSAGYDKTGTVQNNQRQFMVTSQ